MPYLDENGVAHIVPADPTPLPIEERRLALHLLATCYLSQVRHPDPVALERAEREYLRHARQCFPEA